MLEVRLPFSFAFEVDGLYRRTGYDAIAGGLGTIANTRVRANSWEFPLLVKYYFGPHLLPLRPYAVAWYAIRKLSGFDISVHTIGQDFFTGNTIDQTIHTSSPQYYIRDNPVHGVVAGGGLRFKLGHLSISPEARYTHWGSITFDEFGSHGFYVQSLQNQADVMVGITF